MEKYGRGRQAIDDNIIWRMLINMGQLLALFYVIKIFIYIK